MMSKGDSDATNMTGSVVSKLDLGTFISLIFCSFSLKESVNALREMRFDLSL